LLLKNQVAPGLPFLRQLHWIVTSDPASEKDLGRLFEATTTADSQPVELWRYTSPYRGFEAMQEKDSDYFFGRKDKTVEVLAALAIVPRRLPLLIGNSGVGKSSLAQAGVLAALKRQAWPDDTAAPGPWPVLFQDSRQWCFLSFKPGTQPLKTLVGAFMDTWQLEAADYRRIEQQNGLIKLLREGTGSLADLMDATDRRRQELGQPRPPAFLLYIDQGEELYARAEDSERRRFSEVVAAALREPRLFVMMSMRSDFLGQLQSDEPLFSLRQHIDVPPLREKELHEVVACPARLLGARFEPSGLVETITKRAAEDSLKDVGALPLLSYTLDDMWTQMIKVGDGLLRLSMASFDLGGVLAERADNFLARHPGDLEALRRILTLQLAAVRDDGEPTRRRGARSEFSPEEWRLVSELTDFPNRLLVTVTTEMGETYAEVTHETIFKRWGKLREWIAAEREFLAWRTGLDSAARTWRAAPPASRKRMVLFGHGLAQALDWLAKRKKDISAGNQEFIAESRRADRWREVRSLIGALAAVIVAGFVAYKNHDILAKQWHWWMYTRPFMNEQIRPKVLKADEEKALKAGLPFRECSNAAGADICPQMTFVPSGHFEMGSPTTDNDREPMKKEEPQHLVTISYNFAVSTFKITFAEWNVCVAHDGCAAADVLNEWGAPKQPVIYVTWLQAKQYATWLSTMTGKQYRLLSEAEYEYATRGRTQTRYPWGDEVGTNNAQCSDCGSKFGKHPVPVDLFQPNGFGLFEMVGNVWEWVEDCYHSSYQLPAGNGAMVNAPADGSAWTAQNCKAHVVRGGSWATDAKAVRSASRDTTDTGGSNYNLGFRVARSLAP
jgi:formylglycine-generating enzyme required for sulfatase activity